MRLFKKLLSFATAAVISVASLSALTASADSAQYKTFRTYFDLPANSNFAEGIFDLQFDTTDITKLNLTRNSSISNVYFESLDIVRGTSVETQVAYIGPPLSFADYFIKINWATDMSATSIYNKFDYNVGYFEDSNGVTLSPTLINLNTILVGDVNGDGAVTNTDFNIVKDHLLGVTTLTGNAFRAADVNNDDLVDVMDYATINNYLIGSINGF